tara:strand:+ start:111 stop:695 length:585 start_codon:yes stop_codon:yes gene_type:complete
VISTHDKIGILSIRGLGLATQLLNAGTAGYVDMARTYSRRKRNFKQTTISGFENMGAAGAWNSIGYFEKERESMQSAWVDNVKVSFIEEGDGGAEEEFETKGFLWCASNKATLSGTDADNSDYIISGTAVGTAGGGVINLPIKRKIVTNTEGYNTSQGRVYIHVRCTDIGVETSYITYIMESFGRWHTFVPLNP